MVERDFGPIKVTDPMPLDKAANFTVYGYCLTSHATQGRTVDRTFNAVGEKSLPAATRESFYVTNSRSREFTLTSSVTHQNNETQALRLG